MLLMIGAKFLYVSFEFDVGFAVIVPGISLPPLIFSPTDQMVSSGGICLDPATNNIVEYSAAIELLSEAIALGIRRLVAHLDSQLVV